MFSQELLDVAGEILIVGGAGAIILLFFLLLGCLVAVLRGIRILGRIHSLIDTISQVTTLPLMLIQKLFSSKEE